MDCLELNIRTRILSEISSSVNNDEDFAFANESLAPVNLENSLAEPSESSEIVINGQHQNEDAAAQSSLPTKTFMSISRAQCSIAFGEMVMSLSDTIMLANLPSLRESLIQTLRGIPDLDFDPCLAWEEWALPDQLTYTTVSALLRIASIDDEVREISIASILSFIERIESHIRLSSAMDILTQLTPMLHGLYRAIISTCFRWRMVEASRVSIAMKSLCAPEIVDLLNGLLADIAEQDDSAVDSSFSQAFIARYVQNDCPLSGYFIVCCVLEVQWTVIGQVLAPPSWEQLSVTGEAAAANKAWFSLMRKPAVEITIDEEVDLQLRDVIDYAMKCFSDLITQIDEMDFEPLVDTYTWETMSESLKVATVSCVARKKLDHGLQSRLLLLLSNDAPVCNNLLQEAALKATTVLVQSFPYLAPSLVVHLRRFITSPLPIFEMEFVSETRAPPPLSAAAKCLALCIKLAPGDDLILSNMYSLLNFIAATSNEVYESSTHTHITPNGHAKDESLESSLISADYGTRGLSDEEKRAVGISAISVVTRLALEFDNEEVTRLTISMLLQRLRTAEPTIEAAIAYNLVDLALSAPENAFIDIIRAFSAVNRSANPDDPRFSSNMILAAQTRLSQELCHRPEFCESYLVELLTLFADKGIAIQNVAMSDQRVKTEDMIEQLGSLLLPIDALLAHAELDVHASSELVVLFRNMWLLCVLFHFTAQDSEGGTGMEWRRPALARIAAKTPSMVSEDAEGSVSSDLEYSSVVRQEYAQTVIAKHRSFLTKYISLRSSDIRALSYGQIIFLLTMHDLETLRSAVGLSSSLVLYFTNDSLNKTTPLGACMESIAEKVIRGSVTELNIKAAEQNLPSNLSLELRELLIASTHRVMKAREIALRYLNRLITSFPSLMCDPPLVFAILEVLTLLRQSCENEFTDEYNPVYSFHSARTGITLQLPDDYKVRNEILSQVQRHAHSWFSLALNRAPLELQSTLQHYLSVNQSMSAVDGSELGASIAEQYGRSVGSVQRHLTSLTALSGWGSDQAKILSSQLASKGYFAGEAAGLRMAGVSGSKDLEKLPPKAPSSAEIEALLQKMTLTMKEIREKKSTFTVQDLKRLLFRCAATVISQSKCEYDLLHYLVALPFEVSTPSALSAGIEVWTWIIAEKPDIELALMVKILSSWTDTIKHGKGLFSTSMNHVDPFYNPTEYSPTNKDIIDHETTAAKRILTPHGLVLRMLLSRLQAARYDNPSVMFLLQRLVLRSARAHCRMSTHALAREARFSFLLFGYEALKSSHLDSTSESMLRESLYACAYSWFSVRPQWSYGANRVQLDTDVKILSEFMACLQSDAVRSTSTISSLPTHRLAPRLADHAVRLKSRSQPLRLLVESEIFRLSVWANPTKDHKRGIDPIGGGEQILSEASWSTVTRTVWQIDPSVAVHLPERFKSPFVRQEVRKLVRSKATDVLDTPEALYLLVGDRLDDSLHRDLKYLLLWSPVPPVMGVTFFERRYNHDSLILQYAHRVLEEHPVELTFFFVPQIVQALRHDDLGYVSQFIFETAKISQLFCHQIIWNMKANCYKDDLGEIEDPMKPALDRMTELVVESLSGEARSFYDREFGFFNEVTSISGKLKPYIKMAKADKKAKIDEEMAKIVVDVGVYLPSNPDGIVVDIDKKSGRPLQSHAKAPFMATFKVRKQKVVLDQDPDALIESEDSQAEVRTEYDVWQQAIFKVGDDCRQDVLALQIIAMFKSIFTSVGLTLYLFPYRVTATGPGCGVIDVVPNSTSRDEMGRAKVNDLLDFFIAKYGGHDSIAFQKARLNFIQSMAAYSVACYILQIKDRHNGNIMIDGEGHIIHIDFGFLFDIDKFFPYLEVVLLTNRSIVSHHVLELQGVKFEPHSFKLNHEMIALMGGRYSQGYQTFQHLTVKAFLAIRPHAEQLISTVQLMLETGLPSFKGEPTIKRLRDRFALGLNERQASDWMMSVIKNAHENIRSTAYDEFQRLQNGIPYK